MALWQVVIPFTIGLICVYCIIWFNLRNRKTKIQILGLKLLPIVIFLFIILMIISYIKVIHHECQFETELR